MEADAVISTRGSISEDVLLIHDPWITNVLPHFSLPFPTRTPNCGAVLLRLNIGVTPEFRHSPRSEGQSYESQTSNHIDKLELERRATDCRELMNRLCEVSVPIHDVVLTNSRKEENFFGVGLRYLLPYQREAPQQVLNLLSYLFDSYFWVPYHHCGHAALVAHNMVEILNLMGVWSELSNLEKKAAVISAIGHDLGHPGKNSTFFIQSSHPLASLYNDKSVLENYHCSSLLKLLIKPECNILSASNPTTEQHLRKQIIQSVLWTDLLDHFNIMCQVKHITRKYNNLRGSEILDIQELKLCVLASAVKGADLAYMALEPATYAIQWAIDYYEELFCQRAKEIELGLNPSDPMGLSALGTNPWFQRNAEFGLTIALPLYNHLAEFERRLKKSDKAKNRDRDTRRSWSSTQMSLLGLTVAGTQVQLIESYKSPNLQELANTLAEVEVGLVPKTTLKLLPKNSRRANTSDSILTTSIFPSKIMNKMNKMGPMWRSKSARISTTNMFQAVIQPLERNCELLRKAKYLSKLEYEDH